MFGDVAVRCFLSAVETGSFTKTADELYMTRQAVSKQIAQLEKELGVRLFERTTASISLTQAGGLYHAFFTKTLKEWEKTGYLARSMEARRDNRVRVGSPYDMNLGGQVFEAAERCRREGMSLQMEWERYEAGELVQRLVSGRLDVVLSFGRSVDELVEAGYAVEQQFFKMTSAVLLVGRRHPLVRPGALAEDFQNEPCYITKDMLPKVDGVNFFKAEWRKYGMDLVDVRLAPNRDSVQSMVELGRGFTICTELDAFTTRVETISYPLNRKLEIYCIWRQEEHSTPVLAFLEEFNRLSR